MIVEILLDLLARLAVADFIHGASLSSFVTRTATMNRPANIDDLKSIEGKLRLLYRMIEKMQDELDEAEGERKRALLKLIRMGQERLRELRTLH